MDEDQLNDDMEDENDILPYNSTNEDPSWENARFLLRVTQEQSLTYDGIEKFCDCVQDFTEVLTTKLAHQMKEKLGDLRGSTIDDTSTQELHARTHTHLCAYTMHTDCASSISTT